LKTKTYAESGVDIEKEERAIKSILAHIKNKRKGIGAPLGGHYAGMIDFLDVALVLCTDGVGSKVLIADAIKKWDTIGIDCIAMNVNDAICVGAEPLAFVDYLAIDNPNPHLTEEIGKGLAKGAEISNISIIGGETASLPEIINGFDLAGTCLAYVKKDEIITGAEIKQDDSIIGLSSSGIHSNGYTLVRKIIEESFLNFTDTFQGDFQNKKIGEILLEPTRIYVKEILALLKQIHAHGLAHITGGGLKNLPRLKKDVQYHISNPMPPLEIFKFLQKQGNISDSEMYKTFNMGMGFSIIVDKKDEQDTLDILNNSSHADAQVVGKIKKGKGVKVPSLNLTYD
jgi:phosphoribosylformylglycinamidine cyclo-ligase